MNDKHDNRPVRRDDNLPVLVSGGGPEHDQVPAEAFPAWSTIAGQQHIRAAVVAPGGELWLATTGGMLRWSADLLSYSRYGSEHGLPGNAMHRVAVDGSGQVWVISASGALYFLDGARWRAYGALCHTPLTGLSLDLARGLWVTGSEGVWRVDSERKAPWAVPDPPDMTHRVSAPHALAVGRADDIWLASTRGLFHYDGVTWKGPREFVGILSLVREGASLWLGTAHGLRRIDLDRGELVTRPEWPAGPTAALCPAPGGVWAAIGTTTGRATATSWRSVRGKLQSRVTALAPARPDDVWIATQSGLWRGSSGGVEPQATAAAPDAIQSAGMGGQVTALGTGVQALVTQQDASGTLLWIGTSRGAFRFNTSSGLWRS
ncbi:MAG TPA: hypothetical protein VLA19_17795, partial [Herpetosiphonaceae bacterium]|nr:hypothetical protein [Herpetosiphonaceae bacterium]